MQLRKWLFIVIMVIVPLSLYSKNKVYPYDVQNIELEGCVKKLTCPGLPGFESIAEGDQPETGPYLILDEPIDVGLKNLTTDAFDEPENNVDMLQLAIENDKDFAATKANSRIKVNGWLYHGFNGHHHTLVLFLAKKVTVIAQDDKSCKAKKVTESDLC